MAVINPFRALSPPAERVAQVASPPYDVVNTNEARAMAADQPLSFLHVSRPEIDLPENTDIYSDVVYAAAAENFRRLIEQCPLQMDDKPNIYIYQLRMGEHVQTGVAACCSVDEYDDNLIRKHERTRADKEDDRTRHTLALRAQTGPVFLTYRPHAHLGELVAAAVAGQPLHDFTAPDDVRHTVWRASHPAPIIEAFREVPLLYIADGHHRAASASRARAALRTQIPDHTAEAECDRFLAVIFPADHLQIFPYNRVVRDLNSLTPDQFLARVAGKFHVAEGTRAVPGAPGHWKMYLGRRWYDLTLSEDVQQANGHPVESLDVSVLQDNLLDPILGIKDVRTDRRIDFVGGIRGTSELEWLVDSGRAAVAFSLYPTSIDDLLRVADAGEIMPPKSTWFEPKLRDGLLIHCI